MCAVAGVYAYSPLALAVDRGELRAVRDHMAARGPDGSGEWFSDDRRVGLAHRRLAIIDLSDRAAQPMASADGQIVISFNGEIYNYRELRSELQAQGKVFTTESDTEVLLHLYREHGTAMLDKLRGMFAFALWDARERALLLARDPFGIKPLYYADDGKTLRVASQVKALLQAPVDTRPEPAGHAGFFLWGSVPAPWTLYRGIRSLMPGHFMWVREQGAQSPQPYCLITHILAQAAAEPAHGSEEDALDHIAAALRDSVKAHLVSDVPVGVFLSAGLDSAMITSMVSATGVRPRTLTLGFDEHVGTLNDEVPLAQSTALKFHTQHTTLTVGRRDFEAEREKLLSAMDQPSIDGVNTWFVARAAASQGMKVALSGLGGDELFGSYPSFREVPTLAKLTRPFAKLPGLGLCMRHLSEPLLRHLTSPKYAGLIEYGGTLGGAYLLRRGLYMPWELPRMMDPGMARDGWRDLQTTARLDQTSSAIRGKASQRLSVSALEMSWYMRHQLLNDSDWAGMAHSLEIRTPFVDVQLLRQAAPWIAAHPGSIKRKVAERAAPGLPEALLRKPKTGFTVPVRQWLGASSSSNRGLRGWARSVFDGQSAKRHAQSNGGAGQTRRLPRVLVSTIAPGNGGVNAMTAFVVRNLAALGLEPVIAHYAPYSVMPSLSVPSFKLLQRGATSRRGVAHGNHEIHAIGAWLPELEFTHYAATTHWRQLMDRCDAHVAASGNVLAATAFRQVGRPYLAWVATDWHGDREDRVKRFPMARRLLDKYVNSLVIRTLERKLLIGGRVLSLSDHTARTLAAIAGPSFEKVVLPVPIDAELFVPHPSSMVPGRLGFAGRFNDPRKHIGLLLEALAQLRGAFPHISLLLMGDAPQQPVQDTIAALGLLEHVTINPGLSHTEMRDYMQTLDVFVLPSHQEGLCISALEAMACGVPVVSTRCGGPEEFVIPDVTGSLVGDDPREMAEAIASILVDRDLRLRMSLAARALVEDRYSVSHADAVFAKAFKAAFPHVVGQRVLPELRVSTLASAASSS
jgi:asparagine synthase (glutamine-hydrolysing)